jgi:hypothetical protein
MLIQIGEMLYEPWLVVDKIASSRLNLGINGLLYIPFPFSKKTSLVLFRPLITFSFCSHNPSKLLAERSKYKNEHSCFEAYCLNNCNTPHTCGPIFYLLLGFPTNQSGVCYIKWTLKNGEEQAASYGWKPSVTVFHLSLKLAFAFSLSFSVRFNL